MYRFPDGIIATYLALVAVVVAVLLFSAGYLYARSLAPECPSEDSCQPQYEDGDWTIAEVTP